jgi:hypothetical protein
MTTVMHDMELSLKIPELAYENGLLDDHLDETSTELAREAGDSSTATILDASFP